MKADICFCTSKEGITFSFDIGICGPYRLQPATDDFFVPCV